MNRKNVLERLYLKVCPFGKKATAKGMLENEILGHIETYIDNTKMKLENVPIVNFSLIYEYEKWRRARIKNDWKKLPSIDKQKIEIALNKLLIKYPQVTKVWLTGSYANGDYINEFMPSYYLDLKKKVKGKSKISDVDFVTEPVIVQNGIDFDLLPNENRNKLLIWQQKNDV